MFEEEEDGFGFTFQEVGKRDASKTLERVNELDSKLYSFEDVNFPPAPPHIDAVATKSNFLDNKEIDFSSSFFGGQRYGEQNQDENGLIEVKEWAQNFHFLRIEGSQCPISKIGIPRTFADRQEKSNAFIEENFNVLSREISEENSHYLEDNRVLNLDSIDRLLICGRQLPIGAHLVDCDEEILAMDGVLEEVLAIDCSDLYNNSKAKILVDNTIAPEGCEDREAVATIRDRIWPVVVDALRPLVAQVLTAAKKHNVVFMESVRDEGENEAGDQFYGEDETGDWE